MPPNYDEVFDVGHQQPHGSRHLGDRSPTMVDASARLNAAIAGLTAACRFAAQTTTRWLTHFKED